MRAFERSRYVIKPPATSPSRIHPKIWSLPPVSPVLGTVAPDGTVVEVGVVVGIGVDRSAGVGVGVGVIVGDSVGVRVGVAPGIEVGDGAIVGDRVGVGVGVEVGVGVDVGVGLGVGVGVGTAQKPFVIILVSNVTAPSRARSCPCTVAPVVAVIEVIAKICPMN